jgi:hypothetical protein
MVVLCSTLGRGSVTKTGLGRCTNNWSRVSDVIHCYLLRITSHCPYKVARVYIQCTFIDSITRRRHSATRYKHNLTLIKYTVAHGLYILVKKMYNINTLLWEQMCFKCDTAINTTYYMHHTLIYVHCISNLLVLLHSTSSCVCNPQDGRDEEINHDQSRAEHLFDFKVTQQDTASICYHAARAVTITCF